MAFTDLEEHIAEMFGEVRAEDEHTSSVQSRRGTRGHRTEREKHRLEHQRRIRRAMERFLAELEDGTRTTTCRGPFCCNLLKPQRGSAKEICSDECKRRRAKMRRMM